MNFPPPSPKQAHVMWLALTGLAFAVLAGLVVALIIGLNWTLKVLSPVLWPLAVAAVLAYLLDPVVDWLERRGARRSRAILMVFVLALMLIAALFASVVPQIINETSDLVKSVPRYAESLQHRAETYLKDPPDIVRKLLPRLVGSPAARSGENEPPGTNEHPGIDAPTPTPAPAGTNAGLADPGEPATAGPPNSVTVTTNAPDATSLLAGSIVDRGTIQTATGWVTRALPKVGSGVAGFFGVLAGLALIPVYAFYLLLEKRGIESRWTDYLPLAKSAFKDELVFVLRSINSYLIAFFRGQVLVAICDGVLYTIGFLSIGLNYAVLLGVAAVFLTLIPYLGAIITCAAALIIAAVQHGDWLHPLLVLLVFAVVQTLEGFVIAPKIMGDRLRLHPLTIIIAVMAGTTLLGGILGGILAIPLTAVLRVVLARYVWKRPFSQDAG